MLAASRGHVDMTSFLVSALADVNAVDIYLRTTLHMVVRQFYVGFFKATAKSHLQFVSCTLWCSCLYGTVYIK